MSNVLAWVKSNITIVIFLVVMLAPIIAMPIVAGKLNASVREEAESRGKKYGEMSKFQNTPVQIGEGPTTESKNVLINQKLLDAYKVAVEKQKRDADSVYSAAIAHNRKDRGVLIPRLFPSPPMHERQVLPKQFFDDLQAAYDDLFREINAGSPPESDDVASMLSREQRTYMTNILAMDAVEALDEEQAEKLKEHLRGKRIGSYLQTALGLSLYAARDDLALPTWDQTVIPSQTQLFEWQWQLWMYDDFLRALSLANGDSPSVNEAPVKRLLGASIDPYLVEATQSSSNQFPGTAGRGGGAPKGRPLNPNIEAALDYGVAITGRQTNPLYDVRYLNASLIVDPVRTPEILDALARQNFITVVDLRLSDTDPYEALKEGYFYGTGSVAQLDLTLEVIWLRDWTKQFMPGDVRALLSIPPDSAATPAAGESNKG